MHKVVLPTFASFLCILFLDVRAIYIPWGGDNVTSENFGISILALHRENSKNIMRLWPGQKSYMKGTLPYYLNISQHYTLDERCERGMPLSVMWHQYSPYAETTTSMDPLTKLPVIIVKGLFPKILSKLLSHCCHKSPIKYGLLLKTVRGAEDFIEKDLYDFTFPIYGFDSKSTTFKDHPFISLVKSPRVILLIKDIPEKTSKTETLLDSILQAWPFLMFIFMSAMCAGFIMWFLDRRENPEDFPGGFFSGTSQGFWWAFITMTTIGYGDKTPKGNLSRAFCCLWMVLGLTCFSIYTGLVTAALSSSPPPFSIPGSTIGALNGSEEYRLGVFMQANMKVFDKVTKINKALKNEEIDGALIDSFIINYFGQYIKQDPFIVEQTIAHTINYGVVLGHAPHTEKCFRNYVLNNPREMFNIVNSMLKPLKNPTDAINQDLRAAEDLLANEGMFNSVMEWGGIPLAVVFFLGTSYDVIVYFTGMYKKRKNNKKNNIDNAEYIALREACKRPSTKREVKKLTKEFESFQKDWLKSFDDVHKDLETYERAMEDDMQTFGKEDDRLLRVTDPQPSSSSDGGCNNLS